MLSFGDLIDEIDEVVAAADAATGGALSVTVGLPPGTLGAAAATSVVVDAAGQESAGSNRGGTNPVQPNKGYPPGFQPPVQDTCCQRYRLANEFLLDTLTGKVWRYSQEEKAFSAVPRKLTQAEYLRAQVRVESLLEKFKHKFAEDVLSKLPPSARGEIGKQFENDYVKVIEAALSKMKPAA